MVGERHVSGTSFSSKSWYFICSHRRWSDLLCSRRCLHGHTHQTLENESLQTSETDAASHIPAACLLSVGCFLCGDTLTCAGTSLTLIVGTNFVGCAFRIPCASPPLIPSHFSLAVSALPCLFATSCIQFARTSPHFLPISFDGVRPSSLRISLPVVAAHATSSVAINSPRTTSHVVTSRLSFELKTSPVIFSSFSSWIPDNFDVQKYPRIFPLA